MSSRSSSKPEEAPLPIGTVQGHRGNRGELTVKVVSGDAERWAHLTRVLVEDKEGSDPAVFEVETSRHYRDRLILKLETVDGPDAAERLRGKRILAPAGQVPELEEGTYYLARLVGLEVLDEEGSTVGEIEDILEAGGSEVLVIREEDGSELLVPLARDYVGEVDPATGTMVLRGIEGLRGLNREEGEDRR